MLEETRTNTGHKLFSIGLVVTVSLETKNGLGQHEGSLLPWQLQNFQKVLFQICDKVLLHLTPAHRRPTQATCFTFYHYHSPSLLSCF